VVGVVGHLLLSELIVVSATLIVVFALAAWLTLQLSRGRWLVALDHPNERSLHDTPTPRTGGLAIVASFALAQLPVLWLYGVSWGGFAVAVAVAMVLVVSLADDLRDMSVTVRLSVQAGAAVVLIVFDFSLRDAVLPGGQWSLSPLIGATFSLLMMLWLTNLYNFMDGIDGLAGGMGVIGFAALGVLGAQAGDFGFFVVCAAISAACGGFLVFNYPPARIFMGDAGSSVLGLLAAALSLKADRDGLFPLWLSVLVFSPFIVDATVTLIRRALQREVIWQAHRSHFYQRLVGLGLSHQRTTQLEYLLMLACAASALLAQDAGDGLQSLVLFAWAATYAMLILTISAAERRRISR
jgi:UDP-N-acetylmuramyl pentapeptide phosphotransferase/UDP-N-acetylglucosamine-1-phosphate transferase